MTPKQQRLIQFAERTLRILERVPEWNAETTDLIAQAAYAGDLAYASEGLFHSNIKAHQTDYGAPLRVWYDKRPEYGYTAMAPRWAYHEQVKPGVWRCAIINSKGFMHTGKGCHERPGVHLGERVHWRDLPQEVQRAARKAFPEYCPKD